jgi:polysaccharide export outer membrane protein
MTTTLISFSLMLLLSPAPAAAQTPSGTPTGTSGRTSTSPSSSAVAPDYKLVAGDKLRIEVYKDAQLSQSLQVRPDGKITLPLAGDVVAAGRTPIELRDSITNSLKTYITNPTVTVIVVETVPPVAYVMGEVTHPGPQPLKAGLTALQALSMAGGFREFANTKNIVIRRGKETIRFNYKAVLNGEQPDVVLRADDTIVVK